jgi:CRISPR-associated protein Cas5h
MIDFVSFVVESDWGHFRRPYTSTTLLTFPVPPRTALCGLIGAILGLPKDKCPELLTDNALIGIRLLRAVKVTSMSFNLLDTKSNTTFRPKSQNPHTTARYELISRPCYEIYFSHPKLADELFETLAAGSTHFTPCLGLAWMICWFESKVRKLKAVEAESNIDQKVASIVRSDRLLSEVRIEPEGAYQRVKMPAVMQENREVSRYQEYIIETTGRSLHCRLEGAWKFGDDFVICPM